MQRQHSEDTVRLKLNMTTKVRSVRKKVRVKLVWNSEFNVGNKIAAINTQ